MIKVKVIKSSVLTINIGDIYYINHMDGIVYESNGIVFHNIGGNKFNILLFKDDVILEEVK